ncbi:hypothetical protein Lqui_2702 [Legionella quinlivanii]|uniref:VOC domain-containing protein n=1 Tax=Legionella quinlivanii TaxID=45073 RepID=A0A0W0XKZ7_9GAMM|nr:VOC family protein [Legionella quinlivanii]KTD45231.1 hypothetical protein Lqui_2702 [Legionella quinlivanii]MCW8450354.1 VOC family protein [Legionella quinlivanii]SEG04418.1 methylmalonyl-CoA epimerase [Legionella quinlivanii DSM 21216]STY11469.1 4-hydroxyphenylpyruvate dioxygenase and related hemolysins [Legionella quinlivanii]
MIPDHPVKCTKLSLGEIDHYTLIVENAEKVADFHINLLGFNFQYIKHVNSGTVADPDHDMTNYILTLPANPAIFCVITQGMNEETVFRKYHRKFGEGIHHIAYKVDDLSRNWNICEENKITRTSTEIITDPVSGLKQFFIVKDLGGYFIELIERSDKTVGPEDFASQNMKKLSDSIKKYV